MKATLLIESIFGNRSRVRVLRVLNGVRVPLNASQIASRTGLSQPAVSAVLDDLAALGIVNSAPAGRAWVHWLAEDNIYVERIVVPAFAAEEGIPEAVLGDLRETFGDISESVVLFGSYARGEQGEASDIDVVLVGRDSAGKAAIDAVVAEHAPRFARRFGASLSAIVYDSAEAAALQSRSPALFESIEQDGMVLEGRAPYEWRRP